MIESLEEIEKNIYMEIDALLQYVSEFTHLFITH